MNSAYARPLVVARLGRTGRLVTVLCLCAAVLGGSGAAAQGDDISTLAVGCGNRTTIADFLLGGLDGVMASESDSSAAGGQLRLQATAGALFLAPVLGPDWTVTRGPAPTIVGGVLDGQTYTAGLPVTSAAEMTATYGAGVACEVRAMLRPGSNFSSVGFFSSTSTIEQWAYFSTFGTGTDSVPVIHTSVRGAGGSIVGVPTAVTLGEWHDFRIVWQPGVLEFYVDGALVDTRTGVDITLPQRFGYYKSGGSATSLLIDWVRITPYTTGAGSYESPVQDSGVSGTAWNELTWTGDVPAGTDLTWETRSGETSEPDGSWSAWDAVSGFAVASPPGRYAQFRANLVTGDLLASPVVDAVQLCYDTPPDTTAPAVVAVAPPADAVDVPLSAPVTATFDEPIDPATVTTASFTLVPFGGEAVAATVALDSTGTVATLTSDLPLVHLTQYEARVWAAVADTSGNALGADVVWAFTTVDVDLEAPYVTGLEPLPGATEVMAAAAVRATFNEALDPATLNGSTFTLKPVDGSPVAAVVSWDGATLTASLVPEAELAYATTYEARLTTAVADTAGNPLAGDEVWTFTTRLVAPVCITTTTTADFAAGTPDGVMVSERDKNVSSGQLRLQATASALFLAPVLGPDWTVTRGPAPTIVGGVLDGQTYTAGLPVTSAAEMTASYGAGVACEVRALLQPGSNFSSVGFFSGTATTEQWAYFSTFGTGTDPVPVIHTSVRGAGGSIVGVPTAVTLGEWHDFRIVWQPGVLEFYVDGALVDTRTGVDITLPQRFGYYKSGGSATSLLIDWVRITPYTTGAGSWESPVQDAGIAGSTWTDLLRTGETPAGTGVTWQTRTGETSEPDGSWSAWDAVSGFAVASPPGRYAQYRANLVTGDLLASPVVDAVQFCYFTPPDTTAPAVVAVAPPADAVDVPVSASVTATFDEPIDPATVTTASFTLVPFGGEAVAATVALDSTGTVATLTPDLPLVHLTQYEARVSAAVTDTSGNALGADVVWAFTTEDIDLEAPYVVEREPLPGATEVLTAAAVRAVFNEALDPATVNGSTFTLTPAGGMPVAAVVGWDGATLTASLVPEAELEYATTYEARLTTAVADLAGNPLAGDEVWTFTTRLVAPVCITTTTTADFAAGTPDGVMVAERDNGLNSGQLRLQAAVSDLFLGPDPDPQWVMTRSTGQSITDGVMDAQGYAAGLPVTSSGHIETAVGGNVICEMRTQFRPGSNFASMGLQSDSAGPEQATYFSTFGTGDDPVTMIHTVVRDTSGYTAVGVPTAVTLDEWHDFRIVHLPGAVEFYVDGVLVDTRTGVGFTLPLRFAFYKSGGSATPLLVDWARITPYTTDEGTFVSAVHDAGGPGTAWTELLWTGETPTGTGVAYETRTGETAEPDSSWSAWDAVSGFTVASPPGRYAQFRTTLTSGDLAVSPVVDHVQLCYTPAPADSTAPLVVVTEPAADAVLVAVELPVTVTFNEPIDPLTLTTASFTLTPDGGAAVLATVALDSTGTLATLTPDSLLAYGTLYGALLTTAIADTSGNFLAADYAWSFMTAAAPDTTAPTVVATEPAADAVLVAVDLPVTATFSKPIDPASLTLASFTLTPDGGAAVLATVALDSTGTLATLTPDSLLAYGTLYGALLTTAIADTSGNFLAADYAWSFMTAAAPDTTAPTVVATVPAADAVLVAVDLPVTATFSKPIDPATLTMASFTLVPDGGTAVIATVALDSTGTLATLTPEAQLAFGTVYTATLAVAITDTSGTALAADYTWNFTTATGLSAVGPQDLPALTALQPNYPNPFNPRTTVAFDLAREGTVRLRIYSVDGRLVRTLVSQSMPAGRHSVVWNGDDDHGRNVATGVYLLRMETPDRAQTRKMLLMQ